jgi:hypothetical protein
MAWTIANIDNNVKITNDIAKDIFEKHKDSTGWYDVTEFCYHDGIDLKLYFNEDHREHMDFVWEIEDTLKEHKVEGDITFGSLEGDNAGSFWGYRFDGKGGMKSLKGRLEWNEEESTNENKIQRFNDFVK